MLLKMVTTGPSCSAQVDINIIVHFGIDSHKHLCKPSQRTVLFGYQVIVQTHRTHLLRGGLKKERKEKLNLICTHRKEKP